MNQQPWIGVISLDIFKQHIAVYLTDEARLAGLQLMNVEDPVPLDMDVYGAVTVDHTNQGALVLSLLLEPTGQKDPSTWVHEAVHITDLVLDFLGFPGTIDNTEVRAYTTQHIFEQISTIMTDHQAAVRKARKRAKKFAKAA